MLLLTLVLQLAKAACAQTDCPPRLELVTVLTDLVQGYSGVGSHTVCRDDQRGDGGSCWSYALFQEPGEGQRVLMDIVPGCPSMAGLSHCWSENNGGYCIAPLQWIGLVASVYRAQWDYCETRVTSGWVGWRIGYRDHTGQSRELVYEQQVPGGPNFGCNPPNGALKPEEW